MSRVQGRVAGRRFLVVLVVVLGFIATACSSGDASSSGPSTAVAEDKSTPAPLFVLTAEDGVLAGDALTLSGPLAPVVWFTDRPGRKTGTLAIDALVANWDGYGFGDDPPNAALLHRDAEGRQTSAVLELRTPALDATSGDLRFEVEPIGRAPAPFSGALSLVVDDAMSGELRGSVRADYGEPVPFTKVVVYNAAGQQIGKAEVDFVGKYGVRVLPPGTNYRVTFQHPAFPQREVKSVRIESGKTTTVDIVFPSDGEGPWSQSGTSTVT